jgi:L-serine dehydratase
VGDAVKVRYPFRSAAELLRLAREDGLRIDELAMANELAWRSEAQVRQGLMRIWEVMQECVTRGMTSAEASLPGSLQVRRRAARLASRLEAAGSTDVREWVNVFAMAVNEENAAGGRVVTSPTNGAAGIVPAVLHYYARFVEGADTEGVLRFLLAAGTVGMLYKMNASISGAEMGCQGEVGVAGVIFAAFGELAFTVSATARGILGSNGVADDDESSGDWAVVGHGGVSTCGVSTSCPSAAWRLRSSCSGPTAARR